jgi:general secretion pathway protein D
MKLISKSIITAFLTLFLSSEVVADCSYELFSISSTKGTKIIDFIEQLSDECEFSVVITDPYAQKYLNKNLNKTHLKNLTIDEVLNIVLKENNLSYKLENNILRISYLITKIFSIDYILSQRKSNGSTDITLTSSSASRSDAKQSTITDLNSAGETLGTTLQENGNTDGDAAKSGIKIEHNDEVIFWKELDLELQSVLNRPHDEYTAGSPIINKNAGLITVTCTVKQMDRITKYLKRLQDKVQLQVLIDVQLLSVRMADGQSTGVDWSQLYKLQNMTVVTDFLRTQNVTKFDPSGIVEGIYPNPTNLAGTASLIRGTGSATLNEVVKFLQTQGDVSAISNPKVLTLNNQPALITVGTEYFYKTLSTETLAGGNTGTQSQNEVIQSVFSGVLLDITPEIADDKTITLIINPSVSDTVEDMAQSTPEGRTMPPDLERRQLSSVVTVKDGNRIILGGLINTKISSNKNQLPLLGDIPMLGWLFKYEETSKIVTELIIVIEPHIVNKSSNNLSLHDLGYKSLTSKYFDDNGSIADRLVENNESISKKLIYTDLEQ